MLPLGPAYEYTLIDNAEDLDIIMLTYNLLKYSANYSITSEVCGIIIRMKWMMMLMKIMLIAIT